MPTLHLNIEEKVMTHCCKIYWQVLSMWSLGELAVRIAAATELSGAVHRASMLCPRPEHPLAKYATLSWNDLANGAGSSGRRVPPFALVLIMRCRPRRNAARKHD